VRQNNKDLPTIVGRPQLNLSAEVK